MTQAPIPSALLPTALPPTAAIIVAAGRGTRAGGTLPKQWQEIGGAPIVAHALRAFTACW